MPDIPTTDTLNNDAANDNAAIDDDLTALPPAEISSAPQEAATAPTEDVGQDHTEIAPSETPPVNQAKEELDKLREFIVDAIAKSKEQAKEQESEMLALMERMQAREQEVNEALSFLQAELSKAKNESAEITNIASEAKGIPDELTKVRDEIAEMHQAVTKNVDGVATIEAEIKQLQSNVAVYAKDVETNASEVSQHKQTALTEANSATAQKDAATGAASATAKNHAESSGMLIQVQGHVNSAVALEKQISDTLETATKLSDEIEATNVSAKLFLETIKTNGNQAEAARKTATASTQKVTAEEKIINEVSERVAKLEQTINATDMEIKARHDQYGELVRKINGLLPGATSAGLASAFSKQKNSYNIPKICYALLFIAGVVFLAFGQDLIHEETWMTTLKNPWQIMLAHWLQKSPITVPAGAVILFAFKAFSTADKQQQDYAYKERIATTFEGFKAQFADIETPAGAESPLSILCLKLLTIIGQHPARFYEAKTKENLPAALKMAKQIHDLVNGMQSIEEIDIDTDEDGLAQHLVSAQKVL